MRVFAALDLPETVQESISDAVRSLQGIRQSGINWVQKENLHITFQFLGEISRSHLAEIADILRESCSSLSVPHFTAPRLQLIPASGPRILWINYKLQEQSLSRSHRFFCDKVRSLGYTIERKPVVYHTTLGRIKSKVQQHFIEAVLRKKIDIEDFGTYSISIYESILRPRGPEYRQLFSLPLNNF